MNDVSMILAQAALLILIVLLIPCVYRVLRGPTSADRLQGLEVTTNLLIGVVILLMLVQQSPYVLDIGLALVAFAFIATLGIARYLSEGRIF